jgi:hypothetical protein
VKPSCARVLARLRAADTAWVRGLDLASPDVGGLRFGGRIHELRQMGYLIEDRPDPSGRTRVWQYRLLPPPEPVQQTMGLAS